MRTKPLIVIFCAAAALLGCATDRGGTYDETTTGYGQGTSPEPAASPTFRPGMNPEDIRDPNALTRPAPPKTTTPGQMETPPRMSPGATP